MPILSAQTCKFHVEYEPYPYQNKKIPERELTFLFSTIDVLQNPEPWTFECDVLLVVLTMMIK